MRFQMLLEQMSPCFVNQWRHKPWRRVITRNDTKRLPTFIFLRLAFTGSLTLRFVSGHGRRRQMHQAGRRRPSAGMFTEGKTNHPTVHGFINARTRLISLLMSLTFASVMEPVASLPKLKAIRELGRSKSMPPSHQAKHLGPCSLRCTAAL